MVDPLPISFRPATQDDFDFLWRLHRDALQELVGRVYGWEEDWQLNYFQERFDPAARQIILFNGQAAGGLGVEWKAEALYIAYIALRPEFQGRGIGTAVIVDNINKAEVEGLPVTLGVLRGNPAKGLYDRLGFVVTSETEIRFLMERPLPK